MIAALWLYLAGSSTLILAFAVAARRSHARAVAAESRAEAAEALATDSEERAGMYERAARAWMDAALEASERAAGTHPRMTAEVRRGSN